MKQRPNICRGIPRADRGDVMQKSEKLNELTAALVKVQAELKAAKKDARHEFIGSTYADLSSVWEACRALLAQNGLAVIQTNARADGGVVIETMLAHSSGQWIMGELFIPVAGNEKGKSLAQMYGSAVSYGRRYGLQAIVGVCADDDDGQAAGGRANQGQQQQQARQETPPSQAASARGGTDSGTITRADAERAIAACEAEASMQNLIKWRNANSRRIVASADRKEIEGLFTAALGRLKQNKAA